MGRLRVLLAFGACCLVGALALSPATGNEHNMGCDSPSRKDDPRCQKSAAADPPYWFHNTSNCTVKIRIEAPGYKPHYMTLLPHTWDEVWFEANPVSASVRDAQGRYARSWRVYGYEHSIVKECSSDTLYDMDKEEGRRRIVTNSRSR